VAVTCADAGSIFDHIVFIIAIPIIAAVTPFDTVCIAGAFATIPFFTLTLGFLAATLFFFVFFILVPELFHVPIAPSSFPSTRAFPDDITAGIFSLDAWSEFVGVPQDFVGFVLAVFHVAGSVPFASGAEYHPHHDSNEDHQRHFGRKHGRIRVEIFFGFVKKKIMYIY